VNKKGVSPIIGAILMILIAVAISIAVMTISYGMVEKSRTVYSVYFQIVDQKLDEVTVVLYGGPDISYLQRVKISINNQLYVNYTGSLSVGTQWYFKDGENPTGPGNQSVIVDLSPGKNDDHLIVVGMFSNDVETVLIDTYI